MQDDERYVVGVDYGTLSGRAVVVRVSDGAEIASAVHPYASGVMDETLASTGERLPPDWALQDPDDYVEVLATAVPKALAASGIEASQVVGIGTDFTACTILPVLADGTPLSRLPELAGRPHAWVKLWRHHAAQRHADRITTLAEETGQPWLARYGGRISSEWQFAKGLELLEEDPEVYARMDHWVEAADWIIWQLCGTYVRNACSAGYKGQLQDGVHPGPEFLGALNPGFAGFVTEKVEHEVAELGSAAGTLTAAAAALTGLPEGITVAVGNVDAHVTSPVARAVGPGEMLAIMGTSTCHVMSSDELREVPGMCGVVDGGIVAGLYGYEAGQSGVGSVLGWVVDHHTPPSYHEAAAAQGVSLHEHLTALAAEQEIGAHGMVALDWLSGNRSILVDHELSGALVGLTLATRAEDVYRCLLEATAFGTRVIVEAFETAGVPVRTFTAAGGLTKNTFLMQVYADVLGLPVAVADVDQGPALGAALHAAVAAGCYPDVRAAAEVMGRVRPDAFVPDPERTAQYDVLFAEYRLLHDRFAGDGQMHRLRRLAEAGAR